MSRRSIFILCAALLTASIALAKNHWSEDQLLDGSTVERNVSTVVHSIPWHHDLDEAKAIAQRTHRAIFWLHALGDLDGST